MTSPRVLGIGGIFLKAKDPKTLSAWYRDHLGIPIEAWGGGMFTAKEGDPTVWNLFPATTKHFDAPVMVNYRVADLHALLAALRAEGCDVLEKVDDSEYGRFGWVMDPEGNKIELWEAPPQQ